MNPFHTLFRGLKSFILLWASQALSSMGSAMTSYALVIWTYGESGQAMSLSLLMLCSTLPSIALSFFAGALVDGLNKKRVMLFCDAGAALLSVLIWGLYATNRLNLAALCAITALINALNAFQIPASSVATTMLVPRDQYTRVGGLHAFSNALSSLLSPALATAVLSLGGLETVFCLDLASFFLAFGTLIFGIRLPEPPHARAAVQPGAVWARCKEGFRYLSEHGTLMRLILFFSAVNLLASMGGNGLMPALVLSRSSGNQALLGLVSSAIGLGSLLGSLGATLLPAPRRRMRLIFLCTGLSFALCDMTWGLSQSGWVWILGALLGNFPLPFLNANLTAILRERVPLSMQGRVFSARDTLQYATIPIGYVLGGFLADHVFEPLMRVSSPMRRLFAPLVGSGAGSGIAVLFILCGFWGLVMSLAQLLDRRYGELERSMNIILPSEGISEGDSNRE